MPWWGDGAGWKVWQGMEEKAPLCKSQGGNLHKCWWIAKAWIMHIPERELKGSISHEMKCMAAGKADGFYREDWFYMCLLLSVMYIYDALAWCQQFVLSFSGHMQYTRLLDSESISTYALPSWCNLTLASYTSSTLINTEVTSILLLSVVFGLSWWSENPVNWHEVMETQSLSSTKTAKNIICWHLSSWWLTSAST